MRTFVVCCALALLGGCASTGGVIRTEGSAGLPDAQVARLLIPGALTLLTVDDAQVPGSRGRGGYEVRLAPGPRRLQFAYEQDWGKGGEYDWVYSDHVVEVALDARPGVAYSVGYPEPATRTAARRLAADLRVWIDAPQGARVQSRQVAAHGSPLSRLLGLNAAEPATDAAAVSGVARVDQAETLLSEQDALQRLKLWWKLASDEQRRAFQAWVESR